MGRKTRCIQEYEPTIIVISVKKHIKITEEASLYDQLEEMSSLDIVSHINNEDKKVANAVEEVLPKVAKLVDETAKRFEKDAS